AGEVDGGVERVAAIREAVAAVGARRQLDHHFADTDDAARLVCHGLIRVVSVETILFRPKNCHASIMRLWPTMLSPPKSRLGASRASTFPALVPAFGIVIGYFALGEIPSVYQLAGLAVVALGFRLALKHSYAVLQLVWRFRSPHHSCSESEMRTSEPKP